LLVLHRYQISLTHMDDRFLRFVWLLCLGGSAAGIASAMLLFGEDEGLDARIEFHKSIPLCLLGGFIGCVLALCVRPVYRSSPRVGRLLTLISIALLMSALGATFGWLVGQVNPRNISELRESTRRGMAVGWMGGLILGLMAGGIQGLLARGRKSES
jgi:hypothetical protein